MDIKTAAAAQSGAAGATSAGAAGRASGDGSHRPSATDAGDPTAAPAGESDVGPPGAAAAAAAPTTAGVGGGVAADGAHGGQKLTCPAAETSAGSTAKAKRRTFYLGDRMRVASTAKGGPDHGYDICFNFLRHSFDTLLLFFLGLCSPALRVILDVLGLGGGVLKYGLYGMAIFLVSVYGLSFVFTLMRTYIVETSIVFAVLQCLVLAVSLRNSDC
uniref:Glycine-rich protein 1-like n=1 Tax=Petromyzon marinus TaxID=7757 RepID=A0AAJ7TE11_PETMA|nr:glycine-rich protein 1-like [Petromyzon marinus]